MKKSSFIVAFLLAAFVLPAQNIVSEDIFLIDNENDTLRFELGSQNVLVAYCAMDCKSCCQKMSALLAAFKKEHNVDEIKIMLISRPHDANNLYSKKSKQLKKKYLNNYQLYYLVDNRLSDWLYECDGVATAFNFSENKEHYIPKSPQLFLIDSQGKVILQKRATYNYDITRAPGACSIR